MTHPTDPVAAMREALKFYASMSSWTLTPREGTARTMHLSDAEIDMGKRARDALALPLPAAPAPTRPRVSTAGSGQEARLVVTPAAPANDAVGALPTRGDVGRPEATRDPVFLLRYRIKGDRPDKNRWHVDSVWFTREEAEAFGNNHAHRWGTDLYGPRWQVYCVPANGDLAALLKAVTKRDALAAERAQRDAGASGDQRAQDKKGGE